MSFARLVFVGVTLLATAGCFKLERRSSTRDQVPTALLGQWQGSWSSRAFGGGTGSVSLRVQTFDDRPVVQLDTNHPCLVPGEYRIVVDRDRLELWLGAAPVFTATIDLAERSLIGSYACPEDQGVWGADWSGDLPPLGDISGRWRGSVNMLAPPGQHDFTMTLDQFWDEGRLALAGEVAVDGALEPFPIDSGELVWRQNGTFEMLLRGQVLVSHLTVQGLGQLEPFPEADGLLLIEDLGGIFAAGTWTATRLPD